MRIEQDPHSPSFIGLHVFMVCIGISMACSVVLMIAQLFKGLGLPNFGEIGSIGVGVFTLYALRERSSFGYWLGMLYAVGFIAVGAGLAAGASEPFFKLLGAAGSLMGIYFLAYFFSRRDFFE